MFDNFGGWQWGWGWGLTNLTDRLRSYRRGHRALYSKTLPQDKYCHWGSITINHRYTYWLRDCFSYFRHILRKTYLYETVWASYFNVPMNDKVLKAFPARWCLHTNTVNTCYGELRISSIVGEMYDFFPTRALLFSLSLLLKRYEEIVRGRHVA